MKMLRAITPVVNWALFLPATVNQTPPINPRLSLQLYSIAGAKLNCSREGRVTDTSDFPEKRFLLEWR